MQQDISDPWIGPGWKGYAHDAPALRRSALAARGWNVLRGDLPLPLAVIRREPLQGNLRWLQRFAHGQGIDLAPHGKTTMSPQLFAMQLDAGAWGITFANLTQARVGLAAGVARCLIANQLVASGDLDALAALLRRHTAARVIFLVDSSAQLQLIEAWRRGHAEHAEAPAFEVLLELGLQGGRTGCRDHEQALSLARRIAASPALRLVGIECYEGLWTSGVSDEDAAMVRHLMQRVHTLARACVDESLFDGDEIIVSAGGSAVFDLVARELKPDLGRPVRALLRSGCYITHDHGTYRRMTAVMNSRLACAHGLHAALEVWALVQSVPEPGLAILSAGKRDISHDAQMPLPVRLCRAGDTVPIDAPPEWQVSALNDQHAYLRFGAGGDRAAGRRPGRAGRVAPVHDLRQVALAGDRRRAVECGRCGGDLLLALACTLTASTFNQGGAMPYNRSHVRGFLGASEITLFESSLREELKTHTPADLARRIVRTRKLRDKYRDLLRRQKLQTRARTGSKGGPSGNANARTDAKAAAFDEALKRFEDEARRRADAEKKKPSGAARKTSRAKPAPAARKTPRAKPVPAAVMLRQALERKHAAEAASAPGPQHAKPSSPQRDGTPPDVRAAVVASRLQEANLASIQGHTSTQARKNQAKRDQRG